MQWATIVENDLNNARAAGIILAAKTTVLATGQANPIPDLIAQVQAEVRGMVGFSGRYPLDADSDTSIPPNLKNMTVQKICREVFRRLNLPLTDQDRADEQDYERILNLIGEGKYPIGAPDNIATTNPDLPTNSVAYIPGFTRIYTRCNLDAL